MRPLRPASLVLASLFTLSACAAPPPEPAPAAPEPPQAAETPAPPAEAATDDAGFAPAPPPPAMDDEGIREDPPVLCIEQAGQWAIGQVADEALVEKVRSDTQSKQVRVIKPGMMVTMDYREDRVNIEVDEENRVTVVRCG